MPHRPNLRGGKAQAGCDAGPRLYVSVMEVSRYLEENWGIIKVVRESLSKRKPHMPATQGESRRCGDMQKSIVYSLIFPSDDLEVDT